MRDTCFNSILSMTFSKNTLLAIFSLLAVSCSSVSTPMSHLKVMALKKKLGMREVPPIVKIDQKKLKKSLTVEERLVAWNKLKKQGGSSVNGKVLIPEDFDPTELPGDMEVPTFSLLPPLRPDGGSGLKNKAGLTGLEGQPTPEAPEGEKEKSSEETGGLLRANSSAPENFDQLRIPTRAFLR